MFNYDMSRFQHIKRRLHQINRKLARAIAFLSLIAIVTWGTNQSVPKTNSNCEVSSGKQKNPHQSRRSELKMYLSYQPPGGGWNNQRIAFENAVVMASILRRTLLVQPLAPHDRMLELKRRYNKTAGYSIYNMLSAKELVPISKLIDFNRLSSLLSAEEINTNHSDFMKKYKNKSWYKVCHNGLARAWIDKVPFGFNLSGLNLEKYSVNFKKTKETPNVAKYRQVCPEEAENKLEFWEFLPELRKRKEEIIYFENGSLFVRHLFFTDYKRALSAQKAIINSVQPAPQVLHNVVRVVHNIGKPFNAIHVRRNDHKTGQSLNIQHWLLQLAKANALQYSNRLYVATDETDMNWFTPLKKAGYNILFAKDFEVFREIHNNEPIASKDIIGFHEQVICAHAKIFIQSQYSTFSRLIQRYRETQFWDKKHFRNFMFSSVKWLNIYSK